MNRAEIRMTGSGPLVVPQSAQVEDPAETEQLQTRFGIVTIYRKNPIVFPHGMLGMPDRFQFCLTSFPAEKMKRFKMLQSLDDNDLSFITLPIDIENPIIDATDIVQGCKDLSIEEKHLALLLIVSVHRTPGAVRLSVNARAPLFMDAVRRVATQYVFHNNKYKVQHFITM